MVCVAICVSSYLFYLGINFNFYVSRIMVGGRVERWCWVTSSAGASYNLDYSKSRAYSACSWYGWGCLDIFTLIYPFFPLSPSLWETI